MRILQLLLLTLLLPLAARAELMVACGAAIRFAMDDMIADYQTRTGYKIKAVYGSLGKLSAQVMHGAPFDLVVAPDLEFIDSLIAKKWALAPNRIYAKGRMALWTFHPDLELTPDLKFLTSPRVKTIAIGDPKLTVYGKAAQEILTKQGLLPAIQEKLITGDNISVVAQYIVTKSADVGFVNYSQILGTPIAQEGRYLMLDTTLFQPLPQGSALLRYGLENNPKSARAFLDYMQSSPAQEILARHGFQPQTAGKLPATTTKETP